jgi:pimeloyl-ACP methyl ester carboxylesterase
MIRQRRSREDAAMELLTTATGVTLSYDRFGHGPSLVLVHGSFTDHRTNWQFVDDALAAHFTVHALARRGRGETDATRGHGVEDEAADVVALIGHIDGPVLLLGHSYGAQVALAAARLSASRIRKLVLYEPPVRNSVTDALMERLEHRAEAADWDGFTETFFREVLAMPADEVEELRQTPLWPQILADAPCTLHDVRAQRRYEFDAGRFSDLHLPVTMQVGTESPRSLYATDALLAVLPDARQQDLDGQGHDAMLTDPEHYARQVLAALRA